MNKINWIRIPLLLTCATFCVFVQGAEAQTPAAAQSPYQMVPGEEIPNLLRVNVGVSLYDSGWYYCNYFYPYYACDSGSYNSYTPFTLGLQADIHIAGMSYLSPGFQVMTGSSSANYYSGPVLVTSSAHITLWEPSLDYVGKFGPYSEGSVVPRFRVGGAVYLGSDGNSGAGFRVGGGASFFSNHRIGLGLDIVLEGGSYHGYWLSGVQLLASPELHF